jgi:hypothetical protein
MISLISRIYKSLTHTSRSYKWLPEVKKDEEEEENSDQGHKST